jgi:beta-glucosidase
MMNAAAVATLLAVPPYLQPELPVDRRVQDLLSRMTLAEKIEQLSALNHPPEQLSQAPATGAMKTPGNLTLRNALQRAGLRRSRLGIPYNFFHESAHGGCTGATVFPEGLTLGASWNDSLVESVFAVVALATTACGANIALAPVINLVTDPRFGRFQEMFSPDPVLTAKIAIAAVAGLQGGIGGNASTYLPKQTTSTAAVIALGKHLAGYGGAAGGLNAGALVAGERQLRDIFMQPWRAFARVGGRAAMPSHQTVLDVPAHANAWLLDSVFRQELGFGSGLLLSDCNDISVLQDFRVASNASHAAAKGLRATVDVDLQCGHPTYTEANVEAALKDGTLSAGDLDNAVAHVLTSKVASRLFENPFTDPSLPSTAFDSAANRRLAYVAAAQGAVLLKNAQRPRKGRWAAGPTLPITADTTQPPLRTTVVGELGCDEIAARRALLGSYTSDDGKIEVPSICKAANARGSGALGNVQCFSGAGPDSPAATQNMTEAARLASAEADLALIVLGDSLHSCGEWGDRSDLDLPGGQMDLLRAVVHAANASGTKTVLVLLTGRPATFGAAEGNEILEGVDAIIWAGRPGEEGSNAIVDVVLGAANPSGRLTANWPRSVGHVHSGSSPFLQPRNGKWLQNAVGTIDPDGRRYDVYRDDVNAPTPLYRFGFGLSFTSFALSALDVQGNGPGCAASAGGGEVVATVHFTVANTGMARHGEVVPQIYLVDPVSDVVRPWKRLVGFAKVGVGPGESARVRVDLLRESVALHDAAMRFGVERGVFNVSVGQSSMDEAALVSAVELC